MNLDNKTKAIKLIEETYKILLLNNPSKEILEQIAYQFGLLHITYIENKNNLKCSITFKEFKENINKILDN